MVEGSKRATAGACTCRIGSSLWQLLVGVTAQAAKSAGWTAARAEQSKRTRFRKDVNVNVNNVPTRSIIWDHAAFRRVPFAVETCGCMGNCKAAVKFVERLGDFAAESGRIPEA